MNPDQCTHCLQALDSHTALCPFSTGLWPAEADERCTRCREPLINYVRVLVAPKVSELLCIGCAILAPSRAA